MLKKQLALLERKSIRVVLEEGSYADKPYYVDVQVPLYGSYRSHTCFPTLEKAINAFAAELAKLKGPVRYTADTGILRERIAIALTHAKAREGTS
ncbi:hypothetical protein O0S10_01540 [Methanocorpusculum sp. MG]|uniref:Uncharacterized protein n=1 Tax=Methanocorpusculum petauri TaxID=3002863 RepID=A0ABT4IEX8_9EURY|nr:hypothetical protein [Methanocorpusculum petauri]MCZ0859909.1 hypothetical protein [Methanocorpusculum petauri]